MVAELVYLRMFQSPDWGLGSAVSVALVLIVALLMAALFRLAQSRSLSGAVPRGGPDFAHVRETDDAATLAAHEGERQARAPQECGGGAGGGGGGSCSCEGAGGVLSSGSGRGELPRIDGVDEACTSLLYDDGGRVTVDKDEPVVGFSSTMAPFALQTSNCSFVNPLAPCKSVSFRERESSMFAPIRSDSLR